MDTAKLQRLFAEHKVYDAWLYIVSIYENIEYMQISHTLLHKVCEHRKNITKSINNEILQQAYSQPNTKIPLTKGHLQRTNFDIVGIEVNDTFFLKKTLAEFFHYARISIDLLFQVINAAILCDNSVNIDNKSVIQAVIKYLDGKTSYETLHSTLISIRQNSIYEYLTAFDNYLKHIKTIAIRVENSILFGENNDFIIGAFIYDKKSYDSCDALERIDMIKDFVIDKIEKIISEVAFIVSNEQISNKRIQSVHFLEYVKKDCTSNVVESISFFINVNKDLSELPSEIAVHPLIIKPTGDVFSFDLQFDKIFIRCKDNDGNDKIIGCATIKNGLKTNEFYRLYTISKCDFADYSNYLVSFSSKYKKFHINYYALDGNIIFA